MLCRTILYSIVHCVDLLSNPLSTRVMGCDDSWYIGGNENFGICVFRRLEHGVSLEISSPRPPVWQSNPSGVKSCWTMSANLSPA